MTAVGLVLFICIAALLFLLVWLYFLYFDQPLQRTGWSKLPEEHMSILERKKAMITTFSNPQSDYIKMGYGIIDEEPVKRQYLFAVDEVQNQLNVPIHTAPTRPESPAPPIGTLRKAISTDSLDSTMSSLTETESEEPTVHLVLTYHEPSQMLTVQVEKVTDLYNDIGHVWLLFFLLPHPKPLWRTAARTTPASMIVYNCVYQQCVRKADLPKIALLVQLYSSKQQQAAIGGQCRLRLKDVDIIEGEVHVSLCLQPPYREQQSPEIPLGEVLFMVKFTREVLTVVISKVRCISGEHKHVFIRTYVVLPMGKSVKKKTSQRELVNGIADINETMIFNVSRRKLMKGSIRLSVVCGDQMTVKSIGHITLNAKSSGKELGHWTKAFTADNSSPTMRWHSLKPRRTH